MSDLDKLKLHLKNLKEQGHTEFNINVDWLLTILNNFPKDQSNKINLNGLEVDGGQF